MYKRLTPCIFIERGKAVQWFDDRTVIADDVMELARHYNERGADELIIFDLSDSRKYPSVLEKRESLYH